MNGQKRSKELLFVFVRNPELGKVKTRLAAAIGDQKALDIYNFLLQHTKQVTQNLPCDKAIYYSVKIRENDLWNEDSYQKHQQYGTDLGSRMQQAFINSFADGYEKAVIIGSDLPDLKEQHIVEAFQQLDSNDVVLGPAKDGGYYLLGMKIMQPDIFQNKRISDIGGKGVFCKQIEEELLESKIDLAIHSLKDLPTKILQEKQWYLITYGNLLVLYLIQK